MSENLQLSLKDVFINSTHVEESPWEASVPRVYSVTETPVDMGNSVSENFDSPISTADPLHSLLLPVSTSQKCILLTFCVPCIILQCVNDQRDAQFLQSILVHNFCLLYMFRMNLVVHHQEHKIMYCIKQIGTFVL